jgi:hypothetical protein
MGDRTTYTPPAMPKRRDACARLMARAASLRADAAEVAWKLGSCTMWQMERGCALMREHEALMLRAIACEHMARGEQVLARHYVASARRVEAGA